MLTIQGKSLLVHVIELTIKLCLDALEMLPCPRPERLLQPVLHPIDHNLPDSSLLLVAIPGVLEPSIKTSADLLLHHAAHVVGHDLLGEALGFGLNGDSARFARLDFSTLV